MGSGHTFWGAFVHSLIMIIVTELGDKTFFLAALMAMRHPRSTVFIAAIGALGLMHVLSVGIGFALPSLLPRIYTHYAAIGMVSCANDGAARARVVAPAIAAFAVGPTERNRVYGAPTSPSRSSCSSESSCCGMRARLHQMPPRASRRRRKSSQRTPTRSRTMPSEANTSLACQPTAYHGAALK